MGVAGDVGDVSAVGDVALGVRSVSEPGSREESTFDADLLRQIVGLVQPGDGRAALARWRVFGPYAGHRSASTVMRSQKMRT